MELSRKSGFPHVTNSARSRHKYSVGLDGVLPASDTGAAPTDLPRLECNRMSDRDREQTLGS
jgi:hypothetical protein